MNYILAIRLGLLADPGELFWVFFSVLILALHLFVFGAAAVMKVAEWRQGRK